MNELPDLQTDLGMTPEQLKIKWKPVFDHVTERVFTWTEDHTMAYLAEQALRCDFIAESGTYMGASALMMLEATNGTGTQVFAVDPFMVAGTEHVTRFHLRTHLESKRACVLAMRSGPAVNKLITMGLRGKLDMVFIDDGHAYEDVCYDIDCWLPMVRPGGLICGHDLDKGSAVHQAVSLKLPDFSEPVSRLWAFVKP